METHPDIQAAIDKAMSPETRDMLLAVLRWPQHIEAHRDLYRAIVNEAAQLISDKARALRPGEKMPLCGPEFALYTLFGSVEDDITPHHPRPS